MVEVTELKLLVIRILLSWPDPVRVSVRVVNMMGSGTAIATCCPKWCFVSLALLPSNFAKTKLAESSAADFAVKSLSHKCEQDAC